jgi:hypothetical protein
MPPADIPPVKRWLSQQLRTLDSVRAAPIHTTPDLVLHLWSSSFIHVHVLSALWKVRQLKRTLGEATRVGIGSLFFIDHALVPADGQRLQPDETLLALHSLCKERLYTYRAAGEGFAIGQVHFKSFGRDEVETWYGPDLELRHLPVYKVWAKTPYSIRGEWLIAQVGSETFWKSADYTAARDAFRQQARSQNTYRATWSSTSWGGMGQDNQFRTDEEAAEEAERAGSPPPGASVNHRLDAAYQLLGIGQNATQDEVKAAFRRLAREYHPDVSRLPDAEQRFKQLNAAYSLIRARAGW